MTSTIYAHAERLASAPFQAPVSRGELAILDAEIVAINGVPVAPEPTIRRPVRPMQVPLDTEPEPHWLNPRYNPEPYLMAARIVLPAAAVWLTIWGMVSLVEAAVAEVSAHITGIGQTAGGIGLVWVLLALIGGGGAACAGLHCAGCGR